jgi:hypothetical protein
MLLVEQCENWFEISMVQGHHCWNCVHRNGYPYRAQPSRACSRFLPRLRFANVVPIKPTFEQGVCAVCEMEHNLKRVGEGDGWIRYLCPITGGYFMADNRIVSTPENTEDKRGN